jgi:hypothetical protein
MSNFIQRCYLWLLFGFWAWEKGFWEQNKQLNNRHIYKKFDRALLILLEKYLCYSRSYEFQDCWSPQGSATIGSFFVFLL